MGGMWGRSCLPQLNEWTQHGLNCGLNAKKRNPINVISIGFSKKLASRRGADVKISKNNVFKVFFYYILIVGT